MVRVSDDGPAVPPSERERMFQAYERVHDQTGTPDSVGLGLTVCRRLSRLMGGDVTYQHDGSRSVFELLLPTAGGVSSRSDPVVPGEVQLPVRD
jgi:signal transduction histidine kinase